MAASFRQEVVRHSSFLATMLVVITLLAGLIYVVGQQSYRQSANDPQIQMAEDLADTLSTTQSPQIPPEKTVNIFKSLAPFTIIYDDAGNVLSSSAELNGQTPKLPESVLEYARNYGENRITWEPQPGVRIATVITRYQGPQSGFVLAGRNMREVEMREGTLTAHVMFGWLAAVLATVALTGFSTLIHTKLRL